MSKRVVVTGGAGFLGAALVKRLLSEGHRVVVLDNFWRGKLENLADHEDDSALVVIEGDVTVSADLDRCAAALGGVDLIHHMAAVNGTRWFDEAPLKVIDVNINGTLAVLKKAVEWGARTVLASSRSLWGKRGHAATS